MSWMEDVVKLSDGEMIAVDGKTQRRSHDRKRGMKYEGDAYGECLGV